MASETHNKPDEEEQHSKSDLMSSAKLVAEAAQSTFGGESDKVDKAKVADAAGDLLDAAGQYGKLDDQKGIGQYVDKASDYLHKYQSSSTTTTTTTPSKESKPKSEGDDDAKSGGGLGGGFGKLAGSFLK
ncbi:nodulin-related protein 2 [Gastrolobium bilobum]|uniref:nodulin-related protein 2 n=1 Tax=Gastrolobium bilobum TaxID=150636 RepID=UPI002AB09D8F|nr:nodulin-related protein 2 [Gastrolobium bilobum]